MAPYRPFISVLLLCALLVVCGESAAQNTASSDADLSGLTLSAGTLDPAFARDSLAYTATVANSTTSLTVMPTSNHNGATITVNGTSVSSGNASSAISLSVGENTITIVVAAEDGTTTKTYTVTVERGVNIPDANLRAVIEGELEKSSGAIITPSEMATLTFFYFPRWGISDLTGLEYAISLTLLDLARNRISDISALQDLTSLEYLGLHNNNISDISALQDLTSLEYLYIKDNHLNYPSLATHIPALQSRGVNVHYDARALTSLVKISGDDQITSSTDRLSDPLIVEVRDQNDVAFAGVPVAFSVTAGGGPLSTTTDTTDANGHASTRLTLGAVGADTVVAAIDVSGIDKSVTFTTATGGTADLKGLTLSTGTLVPAFVYDSLSYTATVAHSIDSLTIMPTSNYDGATITVNGTSVSSGSASSAISLSVGENPIAIVVAAEDGTTTKTYTVTVVRDVNIPDATLRAAIEGALKKSRGAGITPSEMATMTRLDARELLIRDLTGLEHATRLTHLDLSRNPISDISVLAGLTRLEHLNLESTPHFSDISPLAGLTRLTHLNLSRQSISNISALSGLTSLTHLNFFNSDIDFSDISVLAGLTRLEHLNLGHTNISDISVLAGLTRLEHLNLKALNIVQNTFSDISPLAGLTRLTYLDLGVNRISDISPLAGLTSLTYLDLVHNRRISDISPLAGLTRLENLNIAQNTISDISPLAGLTSLTYLASGVNRISDISPLAGLTHLERLYLGINRISDISPLAGLTRLENLSIAHNPISDISVLAGLTRLEHLNLKALNIVQNTFSDISPLAGLTSLRTLWLNGNLLNYPFLTTHIPDLQSRGVSVIYDTRTLTSLVKISGDDQTGTAGSRLSDPFIVEVRDQNDVAFAGVPVAFSVTAGGGSLSTTTDTTDANGRASTRLTLGAVGANTVKAIIDVADIDKSVTFTVTAAQVTGPVTVVTEPGQVTGVTVAPGEGYLGVSWDAVNGATGYKVQWKSGDAVYASDRQQVIDNGSKTSATIAGLTAGTEYTVRVIATLTDADDGQPSVDVTGTPSDRPPSPPPAPPDPTPDHLPSFKGSTVIAQRYRTGTAINITLPQATGGVGTLTYSLTPALPSGLTFDATTRELSGTPGEIMDETEYTLTATDTDGDATTLTFTLVVAADRLPSFSDSTRVAAQRHEQGTAIAPLTLPTATGGDEALTYALTPALPSGLTFDAKTRVLSGTPQEALDATEYTLTATDADGDVATLTFTLAVIADLLPAFGDGTRVAAQRYIIGDNVHMTLPEATGGDGTLVYILLPALPNGLRFDSTTRTISGTPSKLLTETEYTLSAFDADGDFASLMFTLEVQQPTADFNGDGQVNVGDFLSFAFKYGMRRGDAEYDARYDLDSDGEIGFSDFLIFTDQLDTGG